MRVLFLLVVVLLLSAWVRGAAVSAGGPFLLDENGVPMTNELGIFLSP